MEVEHIADFETAEELTNVEQPKKRKKQGRKTSGMPVGINVGEKIGDRIYHIFFFRLGQS